MLNASQNKKRIGEKIMIFIITDNYDGITVHNFERLHDAEEFCAEFLAKNREYGGAILLAVEGSELIPKTVSAVEAIKLERETTSG